MKKENTLQIKFYMDSEDYKVWKQGVSGKKFKNAHPITEKPFDSILLLAGKFTTFQHLKRDYIEVEITFYEENLLNLVYLSSDIMNQI